jgi:hypothetical protein
MATLKELTADRLLMPKGSSHEFSYESWKDFMAYVPWRLWSNMELCNYVWTHENIVYIYFNCLKGRDDKRHFKINVCAEDEHLVREWIKERIPAIWTGI